MSIDAGMEEFVRDRFEGDTYQKSRMYPVVRLSPLSYSVSGTRTSVILARERGDHLRGLHPLSQ